MSNPSRRPFRRFPFLVVLAIILVPTLLLVSITAADRLGYCVNTLLPGTAGLNTGAYVQNVSTDEATIVWRTAKARDGLVRLTAPDGTTTTHTVESAEIQIVPLTGLERGSTYEWEVESGTSTHEGSFRTAPADGSPVRFTVIGDSGTGGDAQYDIATQLVAADPDAVLHTGDVVYRRGALCHYGPKYFAPYVSLVTNTPVYPAIGNHDLMAGDGEAYFDTFVLPANNPAGTEEYYSFDYGSVHVISLNTEFYASDDDEAIAAQKNWLQEDLDATDQPWTIVMLHEPPYSSTDGKQNEEVRTDLTELFAAAGVDLVLAGHAHNYERSVPIDGVVYIVTGGGGADLRGVDPTETTEVAEKKHHFVQIDATAEELSISAIDRDGVQFDSLVLTTN